MEKRMNKGDMHRGKRRLSEFFIVKVTKMIFC